MATNMFLILPKDEAELRNISAAIKEKMQPPTIYRWGFQNLKDGTTALEVGNGTGLTATEKAACVEKLPE